jgi:hypothetical protein
VTQGERQGCHVEATVKQLRGAAAAEAVSSGASGRTASLRHKLGGEARELARGKGLCEVRIRG